MIKKKPKTVTLDSSVQLAGLPPITTEASVFEHFAGRDNDEIPHNKTGCKVNVECVLVRTYRADPFRLAVKIGDYWYELARIRSDNPSIMKMMESGKMTEYGPSPQEQEKMRLKEEEEQYERKRLEAMQAQRAEARKKIKEEHEEQERQAKEARRVEMGW